MWALWICKVLDLLFIGLLIKFQQRKLLSISKIIRFWLSLLKISTKRVKKIVVSTCCFHPVELFVYSTWQSEIAKISQICHNISKMVSNRVWFNLRFKYIYPTINTENFKDVKMQRVNAQSSLPFMLTSRTVTVYTARQLRNAIKS